jgi:hypothetical protein
MMNNLNIMNTNIMDLKFIKMEMATARTWTWAWTRDIKIGKARKYVLSRKYVDHESISDTSKLIDKLQNYFIKIVQLRVSKRLHRRGQAMCHDLFFLTVTADLNSMVSITQ